MRITEILFRNNDPAAGNRSDPQLRSSPTSFSDDPTNLANAFTRSGLVKSFWNLNGSVVLGGVWPGMVTVETIGRIRRAFWVDKKPIRQIVRELRISRQTVRKAIRGSSVEFRYDRQVQPQPRLGAYVARLDGGRAAIPQRAAARCWN